ncbi:MAG TPA: AAA family ATPase, partial [Pseudonocardia sp.]|nr:AAA family ATPase [Pseudonocardia sp.]
LRRELAEQLGLDPSPGLRALHEQVLRQDLAPAPAVASPARPRLAVSSFVGREHDLDRVEAALSRCRIVTLCGPGGVGKSRLALHAADRVAARYDDGVVHVELAAARPRDVLTAVAAALRLSSPAETALEHRVVEVLAARRQLLVLDDCDHVAEPAAALVEAITTGAPGVDVLLTSREALRADGEQVLPVAPLPVDAAGVLLADRIRSADPDAAPGPGDAELITAVCRRLDGLPLALELAAARVPAVGLAGLLAALDEPFDLLRSGRRTAAPRHRSLHDVVQWSVELLDEPHRQLFERMSVFAGAVEPAAVAAVCGDAGLVPDLVERSLVQRGGDPPTYGMLETLRAFGRSRLAGTHAETELRRRHTDWAVRLAGEVARDRMGPGEAAAVRRFDAHLPEFRAAHARLVASGRTGDLLRISLLLAELAFQRGRVDLVALAEQTLDTVGDAAHPLVARLLGLASQSRWQRGDLAGCAAQCHRAFAVAEAVGAPEAARDAHESLANVGLLTGDLDAARRQLDRALELARAAGDPFTTVMALTDHVLAATYAGDRAAAARHQRELDALAAQTGSPTAAGWAAYAAGEQRAERGDPDAARYLERAVAFAEEVDAAFLAGVARHTLLTTAARADAGPAALERFGPLLDTWHGLGAWTQLWIAVRALVEALSRHGRHREAALLLGALRATSRASEVYGADSRRVERVEAAARAALGAEFETLVAEGAALGDAGAVALARRLTRGAAPAPAPRETPEATDGVAAAVGTAGGAGAG